MAEDTAAVGQDAGPGGRLQEALGRFPDRCETTQGGGDGSPGPLGGGVQTTGRAGDRETEGGGHRPEREPDRLGAQEERGRRTHMALHPPHRRQRPPPSPSPGGPEDSGRPPQLQKVSKE